MSDSLAGGGGRLEPFPVQQADAHLAFPPRGPQRVHGCERTVLPPAAPARARGTRQVHGASQPRPCRRAHSCEQEAHTHPSCWHLQTVLLFFILVSVSRRIQDTVFEISGHVLTSDVYIVTDAFYEIFRFLFL